MSDHVREKAVDAADLLNDFIGDLVGATNLLRCWNTKFQQGEVPESTMVNVQKICISHLVLTLHKFVEFYDRFLSIIPLEHRNACKALRSKIKEKEIEEFRHKCIGHIWDKDQKRPLMQSEIMDRLTRIAGDDMPGFLNWITTPTADQFPSTVVSIVDTVREELMSKYSISPGEFIQR